MWRHSALRTLYASPYFKGRDRLISLIASTFASHPVRLPDGLQMDLDCAEWTQIEILAKGAAEPLTLRLMKNVIQEGDVVVDVGAHVGQHAIVAARACGEAGLVIAIDPQPYNVDRIARNADLNGLTNVDAVCAAVGNEGGYIKFALQSATDRARLSLVRPSPNEKACLVEVPIRRLDDILASRRLSHVKLIKIDVEGYELEVLEGLGEMVATCDHIVFELLAETEKRKSEAVIDLLKRSGFLLRDVLGNRWNPGLPLMEHNCWASRS